MNYTHKANCVLDNPIIMVEKTNFTQTKEQKLEKKAMMLKWRMEMRKKYGMKWTKRLSCKLFEGGRMMS